MAYARPNHSDTDDGLNAAALSIPPQEWHRVKDACANIIGIKVAYDQLVKSRLGKNPYRSNVNLEMSYIVKYSASSDWPFLGTGYIFSESVAYFGRNISFIGHPKYRIIYYD